MIGDNQPTRFLQTRTFYVVLAVVVSAIMTLFIMDGTELVFVLNGLLQGVFFGPALALVVWGVTRRKGEGEYCAKCGYEKMPQTLLMTCSECGADWSAPKGTRYGKSRIHVRALATALSLTICFFVLGNYSHQTRQKIVTYLPTSVLIQHVSAVDIFVVEDCLEQLQLQTLTPLEAKMLANRLVENPRAIYYFEEFSAWFDEYLLKHPDGDVAAQLLDDGLSLEDAFIWMPELQDSQHAMLEIKIGLANTPLASGVFCDGYVINNISINGQTIEVDTSSFYYPYLHGNPFSEWNEEYRCFKYQFDLDECPVGLPQGESYEMRISMTRVIVSEPHLSAHIGPIVLDLDESGEVQLPDNTLVSKDHVVVQDCWIYGDHVPQRRRSD